MNVYLWVIVIDNLVNVENVKQFPHISSQWLLLMSLDWIKHDSLQLHKACVLMYILKKELILPLYKTIVRPHLVYCIHGAWRPYRKKNIDMLERVQRRAAKMIPKLRNISYELRLKECGLTTLETRRLRGDQIEVF